MTHPKFRYRFPLGVGIIAVVALLGVPGQVDATAEATDVTYAKDVARSSLSRNVRSAISRTRSPRCPC